MLRRAIVLFASLAALLVMRPLDLSAQDVRQFGDSTYYTVNPSLGTPVSPYDSRVNEFSTQGALNPYTTQGGRIYAQDGTYLGQLNANQYDLQSVANPYGRYGSEYSPTSVNNPLSPYGSRYSVQSPTNPYTFTPPVVLYSDEKE